MAKIMERTYRSANGVIEKTRYLVGSNAKRQKKRRGVTTQRKQEANFNGACKKLARILNCNFNADGGRLLGLDYDGASAERILQAADPRKAAENEARNFIRRLKRKVGKEIRWVLVTSDLDGDTGELVRLHHHLAIQFPGRISYDAILSCWDLGGVDIKTMWSEDDYTGLARYLLRQVRRIPDAKKYSASRNMELPEITEREILTTSRLRPPKGAKVREQYYDEEGVGQYIRYTTPPKTKKRGGHKRD